MKAVVKFDHKDHSVEVRDVPVPTITDDQVLIKIAATGVCGSDIHMWHEHQSWEIKIPVILGHEFCGTIEQIGKNVQGFLPGERVAVETAAQVCGKCIYCRTGNYNLCPERLGFGNLIDGAMTEFIAVRPQILHRIPDNVSFEYAALTEPVCVANRAIVEVSHIRPGDIVVVQGAGAIGILALMMAKLSGAGTLIMTGTNTDTHRLAVARQIGAHYTVNVQQDDPMEILRTLGDGYGADLVVDCTGISGALKQSMEMVKPLGQITKVGWGPQPLGFSLDMLVAKAARLQATFSHTYPTWERSLKLMEAGLLNLEPVLGGVYPIEQWEEGFSAMESGQNIKSVITTGK